MHAVLVLDQTYQPDRIVSFRRACELLVGGKALPATDETAAVFRSPSTQVEVPAVIQLAYTARWVYRRRVPACSSRAVLIRDEHVCQFVIDGMACTQRATSVDHLVPRSRGGPNTWSNLVGSCLHHNSVKADSTIEEMARRSNRKVSAVWTLRRDPVAPDRAIQLLAADNGVVPVAWQPFLAAG
jgi:5-methylcytosine-specific restriction endonuclease McrA